MELSDSEKQDKVFELIDALSTAMLVTIDSKGSVHARPMAVALRQGEELLFLSHRDTEKVVEISENESSNACFQERTRFISVTGSTRIDRDRSRLEAIWDDKWNVWFPEGVDDPSLVLLCMDPQSAEYWDYSGAAGLRFMLAWAKALITNTGIEFEETDSTHARVDLS